MSKQKEIPAAGFCIIRPSILKKGLKVPVGNLMLDNDDAMMYRWVGEDEDEFQVKTTFSDWRNAQSIDFEFLKGESNIIKKWFKNYDYSLAMEEIKDWSAKDLKEFLRLLNYKTYVKDIMITMVQDLARIHAWQLTQTPINVFLNK